MMQLLLIVRGGETSAIRVDFIPIRSHMRKYKVFLVLHERPHQRFLVLMGFL